MSAGKILVVDDEPRVREMIEFRLNMCGYEVIQASNGNEALACAAEHKPDLVLLDIMMDEPDGFKVCKRLKSDEATKDIPVVMLTAKAEAKDVMRAYESGAVDYIVKPYDPVVLRQKVEKNLSVSVTD